MMLLLVYLYIRQSLTLVTKHQTFRTSCLAKPIIRSYSSKRIIPINVDSADFKLWFLKNKCGLSGKPLLNASKCLNFDSSDQRPLSVLELFRSFRIPQSTVTKIISTNPYILKNFHPEKIIKPKLEFLRSISRSQAELVSIVSKHPFILRRSLTNFLIPSLDLLNSVTGCYRKSVVALKYNPYILNFCHKSFLLNIQFLSTLGVPHSQIVKLLRNCGPVLAESHDKLRNVAVKVKDMGFNLESSYFISAIYTLSFVTDATWESRCVLLRSFGFSNSEIHSMFKKLPFVMRYSERNIAAKMEFFLNKLQWTPFRLSSCPVVLGYSLEKRTISRCSVLQVLVIKNITSESYRLLTILVMSEKKISEDFVNAYKDEVPELIEAYQGKLRFDEYTFKQRGQLSLMQL
ncbi:uncharacterized protein LOC108213040 [Daucus carota subsp. sativus]|nr:PREDICTED: uncharacterized protein LOC108213040 [Daucus carota subsp. sativus]